MRGHRLHLQEMEAQGNLVRPQKAKRASCHPSLGIPQAAQGKTVMAEQPNQRILHRTDRYPEALSFRSHGNPCCGNDQRGTSVSFEETFPGQIMGSAAEHENCYAVVQEFLEAQKKAQDAAKAAESLPKANTESEPTADSIPQTSVPGIQPSRPVSEMPQEQSDDSRSQAGNKAESNEEKEAPTEN